MARDSFDSGPRELFAAFVCLTPELGLVLDYFKKVKTFQALKASRPHGHITLADLFKVATQTYTHTHALFFFMFDCLLDWKRVWVAGATTAIAVHAHTGS